MTLTKIVATAAAACVLMTASASFAATPTGGTTLAGAHNGMHAKARSTRHTMMKRKMMHHHAMKKAM